MTWAEFKESVESQGVHDDFTICEIEVYDRKKFPLKEIKVAIEAGDEIESSPVFTVWRAS